MSNINKQALREAAEKAISEEGETWWNEEQLASDYGLALHRADAKFIAATNPAIVLALLDEIEPMAMAHLNLNLLCEVYRSAYEESRHDGLVNWEAAASLAEENSDLKRKLEAAERRVAELEAREVVLPQRISMEGGAYCTAHARYDEDGDYYYRDEVIESLVAAGIITKVGE